MLYMYLVMSLEVSRIKYTDLWFIIILICMRLSISFKSFFLNIEKKLSLQFSDFMSLKKVIIGKEKQVWFNNHSIQIYSFDSFQGFVSILDTPGVMYVWDQCFLQNWQPSVFRHFALAILMLLRHKFQKARDYSSMKEVNY